MTVIVTATVRNGDNRSSDGGTEIVKWAKVVIVIMVFKNICTPSL